MSINISSIHYCPVKSVSFQNIDKCKIDKNIGIIGDRIFEFVMPKTKNINATTSAHNLIDSELINGQRVISKNIIKNKIPKLLLFSFFFILNY